VRKDGWISKEQREPFQALMGIRLSCVYLSNASSPQKKSGPFPHALHMRQLIRAVNVCRNNKDHFSLR
jgi:hypothetical protein